MGGPASGIGGEAGVQLRGGDRAVADGVDRQVHFPHDACVVCACPGQPHRRDLDYAGVARHRPDDQPGSDHRHLPGITSLVIPALVLVIAPIALMIAISHTLNKLATDSEIIVMNAAGFSPFRLFMPFFYATCVVAAIVAFIAAYLAPDGMRRIKQWDAEITADILTNILQPGRFAQLDKNLTIRIRERQPGGILAGIFIDDRRDPKERVTIIADHGTVLKNENGSYLVLEDGNLERFEAGKRDPALVAFARYAFDMSKFSNQGRDVTLGIRE